MANEDPKVIGQDEESAVLGRASIVETVLTCDRWMCDRPAVMQCRDCGEHFCSRHGEGGGGSRELCWACRYL